MFSTVKDAAKEQVLDRADFRRMLLESMCFMAENIHTYDCGVTFFEERPTSFHPGTGEKLLFLRIIDEYADLVAPEFMHRGNFRKSGLALMNIYWRTYKD